MKISGDLADKVIANWDLKQLIRQCHLRNLRRSVFIKNKYCWRCQLADRPPRREYLDSSRQNMTFVDMAATLHKLLHSNGHIF